MTDKRPTDVTLQQKQLVIEKAWLHYYNDTLLQQGLISEVQHRKMKTKINCRRKTLER